MGKIRTTYSVEFKRSAIDMYITKLMGAKSIAKELGIAYSIVDRWIAHYKKEGLPGLEEKRGTGKGPFKGRPKNQPESEQEKINRLEAENAYLKKLLAAKKGMILENRNR
jgi:transposase